jgi:hypothetical protein
MALPSGKMVCNKPEEIVAMLRQVDVWHGKERADQGVSCHRSRAAKFTV